MKAVRHHFVPQGYLRGFSTQDETSRNLVWVYDKRPERNPRKKSVKSIAWAPAYYAQKNEDGSTDYDSLEQALGSTIDNDAPEIIRRLSPLITRNTILDSEDQATLAFFVGLSMTRVPSYRDGINDFHKRVVQSTLNEIAPIIPNKPEGLNIHDIEVTVKPWISLKPMIDSAQAIADSVLSKNWQFFIASQDIPFVTSDNPVVFSGASIDVGQLGPAHPKVELLMNLRSDLALVCTPRQAHQGKNTFQLSPSETRRFNRSVVRAARHRVFANYSSTRFDAFVKKYRGEEQRIVA